MDREGRGRGSVGGESGVGVRVLGEKRGGGVEVQEEGEEEHQVKKEKKVDRKRRKRKCYEV